LSPFRRRQISVRAHLDFITWKLGKRSKRNVLLAVEEGSGHAISHHCVALRESPAHVATRQKRVRKLLLGDVGEQRFDDRLSCGVASSGNDGSRDELGYAALSHEQWQLRRAARQGPLRCRDFLALLDNRRGGRQATLNANTCPLKSVLPR
jgi:hypothetical protein